MNPSDLIRLAVQAAENAYAPYSNYRVGAALLCADGSVFKGCNIENSSYGLTNCAERTAAYAAIAGGRIEFAAIAIAATGGPAPYPCGACRQVLAEFCGPDLPIYIAAADPSSDFESTTLGELLPKSFRL